METEFLQQLDNSAANVLRKLATTGFPDLTEQDRVSWSCFVTSLLSRTPEAVALIQELGQDHINASLADKPEEYEALADASDPSIPNTNVASTAIVSCRIIECLPFDPQKHKHERSPAPVVTRRL